MDQCDASTSVLGSSRFINKWDVIELIVDDVPDTWIGLALPLSQSSQRSGDQPE